MHSATGMFTAWTQLDPEIVILRNVSKDNTIRPLFQIEDITHNTRIQLKSYTVNVWPQPESQVSRLWTHFVSHILLSEDKIQSEKYSYTSEINTASSSFHIQNISTTTKKTKLEY